MSTTTHLDGATTIAAPGTESRNAGEFAARWNAMTNEQRELAWRTVREGLARGTACFTERHEEALARRADRIEIRIPHVPHGPKGVPEHIADAHYLLEAASHIEGGYKVGSNLTATVIALLRDVAYTLNPDAAKHMEGRSNGEVQ